MCFNLSFDLITCVGVIEELKSPLKALKSMASRLKPSGTLILITVNKHTEFIRNVSHFVKGVRPGKRVFWDRDHINVKNPIQWKRNLAKIPHVEPKLSTNFFMLQFHKHYFFIHLPYFGSSTMILIVHE